MIPGVGQWQDGFVTFVEWAPGAWALLDIDPGSAVKPAGVRQEVRWRTVVEGGPGGGQSARFDIDSPVDLHLDDDQIPGMLAGWGLLDKHGQLLFWSAQMPKDGSAGPGARLE